MKELKTCEIDGCNKVAIIGIDNHIFCMEHYEIYYAKQPKGVLDYEVLV